MKYQPKKGQVRKSKKKTSFATKSKPYLVGLFTLVVLFMIMYHYRNGLAYYLGYKSDKVNIEKQRISDVRNYQILTKYEFNPVGIDVSEYQGNIVWDSVRIVDRKFPLRFVFVRATVGMDRPDKKFAANCFYVGLIITTVPMKILQNKRPYLLKMCCFKKATFRLF